MGRRGAALLGLLSALAPLRAWAPPASDAASPPPQVVADLDEYSLEARVPGNEDEQSAVPRRMASLVRGSFVPAVKSCYAHLLEQAPAARGAITVAFVVDGDSAGSVSLEVDKRLGATVEKCARSALALMRFREDDAGAHVKFAVTVRAVGMSTWDDHADASPAAKADAVMGKMGAVSGSLNPQVIERVIARHRSEVKLCYESALAKSPKLAGKLTLRLVISATGSVQQAAIASSTIGSKDVESCVTTAARTWVFPRPAGGVVIANIPFELASAN